MNELNGVFNVRKEKGLTSHDVVAAVRRMFGLRKAGHTGTLDPNATGVLPVCVGRAVKASEYFLSQPKSYVGQLILGVSTDTQDATGKTVLTRPVKWDTDMIMQAVGSFAGEIYQTPPMYSAVKVGGRKLYEIARRGETVEREPRKARVDGIAVIGSDRERNALTVRVDCGKGLYVRTLFNDIGEKLGCGGCMGDLTRIRCGPFYYEGSLALAGLDESKLIKIEDALPFQRLNVPEAGANALKNGNPIPMDMCEPLGPFTPVSGDYYYLMRDGVNAGIYELVISSGEYFFRVRTMLSQ